MTPSLTDEQSRLAGLERGDAPSDGERSCTDCWDESGHDVDAATDIPKGAPIYWRLVSIEYDEWDAYCERHARARANDA